MYNGEPIEGAVVEFIQEGSPIRSAGMTNASGQFTLSSYAPGDGAVLGANKVTVTKKTKVTPMDSASEPSVPLNLIDDPHERRLESMKRSAAQHAAAQPQARAAQPKDLLPAKYANPETSGLSFTVEKGAENSFQIVLTD